MAFLSAGTDGEDGPTDAAGAFFDAASCRRPARLGLDPADSLARNDAYRFFAPLDGLLKTGPMHTNVGDVRVVVVAGMARRDSAAYNRSAKGSSLAPCPIT